MRDTTPPFERMPYVQIDANLWAVMRYPKDRPVAMIQGVANQDNVPLFFVTTWHPESSRRRVISQHDTLAEANESVLWDLDVVERAQRSNRETRGPDTPRAHAT